MLTLERVQALLRAIAVALSRSCAGKHRNYFPRCSSALSNKFFDKHLALMPVEAIASTRACEKNAN